MKQLKKITIRAFSYELTINLEKETQKEKELKEIYEKFKNGEVLDTKDLMKLQENNML
jgi:uncharacterized coiled-coil DUF342 family protein